MALFSECSLRCARKVLDTADIVREAILRQQPTIPTSPLAWLYFQLVRAVNIFGGASRSLA